MSPVTADLSGRWVYNRELSDDAREKMREGMEKGGGPVAVVRRAAGGAAWVDRAEVWAAPAAVGGWVRRPVGWEATTTRARRCGRIFEPAEELVIAQTETEIAVEEKFAETRHLHPDGKKYKTDNGASEIKVSWKEGQLVIETKRARGGRVVETWERIPDGSRLIVNVKMEGGFGPGLTLKRVYDRAEGDAAK